MLAFIVALGVILLIVALIAIRIIMIPDGEFHGTCGSNNPYMKREGGNCPVCGKEEGDFCPNEVAQEVTGQQKNG